MLPCLTCSSNTQLIEPSWLIYYISINNSREDGVQASKQVVGGGEGRVQLPQKDQGGGGQGQRQKQKREKGEFNSHMRTKTGKYIEIPSGALKTRDAN